MSLSLTMNKPSGIPYMPGETIKGTVIADMDEPKTCDFLILTVVGRADVEIIEIHHDRREKTFSTMHKRSYETITRREVFISEEIYLSGTIQLLGPATLPPGRTVFPFEYSLPTEGLPCTFTASHGRVHYEILVHMKRPTFTYDLREAGSFSIGPLVDLNRVPLAQYGPAHFVDEQKVGGCCCFGGNDAVGIQLIVPKRHFIPGEFIQFRLITENRTGTNLLSGEMQLVLTISCAAQGRVRGEERIFGQLASPAVPSRKSQTWEVGNFVVPVVHPVGIPPSGLGGCNIIDVQYGLRYFAQLDEGCCSGSIKAFIPIIIGTIAPNFG